MELVRLPVAELEIDLPVSEANVAQKKASLEARGLVQPITVWERDMRIIDGFHRVVAAGLLGWEEIDCAVIECDEEAFWDARIQSARQHANIERARLITWILQCWKQTSWARSEDQRALLEEVKHKAWDVKSGLGRDGSEDTPLSRWFCEKAERWGIALPGLLSVIFGPPLYHGIDDLAAEQGLSYEEFAEARNEPGIGAYRTHDEDVEDWIANRINGESFWNFRGKRKREEQEEEGRKRQRELQAHSSFLATAAGKQWQQQELRHEILRPLSLLQHALFTKADLEEMRGLPDGPELVAAYATWAATALDKLWPEHGVLLPRHDALLAENARLRVQLKEAVDMIFVLEARMKKGEELQARQRELWRRFPTVMVLSEGDLR